MNTFPSDDHRQLGHLLFLYLSSLIWDMTIIGFPPHLLYLCFQKLGCLVMERFVGEDFVY